VRAGRDVPGLPDLRKEADAIVPAYAMTVTAKSAPAPSGDVHDYVSLSIYWWPDSSKTDGLPYLQRDGVVNPESSDFQRYDASKLNRMVSSVETLSLAAYLTGDAAYADASARWLRTWFVDPKTRMNPNMRYAQVIPGRNEPRGTGIIDSRQFMRAIDAALLIGGTPSWTAADDAALRAWFADFADWLVTSQNGQLEAAAKNNHGTWYDAQLTAFALYGGRDRVAKDTLTGFGTRRVTPQIATDGTQPLEIARTRSYHYSAFNLLAFAIAADLGSADGVDIWRATGPRIRAAIDLLVPASQGAAWPYPDIDRIDYYTELAPVLARAARAYPDAGYDRLLAQLSGKATAAGQLRLRLGAFGALGGTAAAPAPLVVVA
ncbi:MAG TPA: alginate lyase family protein, partial [Candidatus Limnocylindria bacterium]|nr:alginate lyase family protein [Candidatus Limnocylindria bacterium]